MLHIMPMASCHMSNRETESSVSSLKELVTIISGLAATNSVLKFMGQLQTGNMYEFSRVRLVSAVFFVTTIVLIVRFYQGNIRHLDEEYTGHLGKAYSAPSALSVPIRIATDFAVILSEALLLSALSFLQFSPPNFAATLSVLLGLDAVWFFFVHFFTAGASLSLRTPLEGRAMLWMINNAVFSIAEGVLAATYHVTSHPFALGLTIGLCALGNSLLDIVLLFSFYFPGRERGRNVFLAAPFTGRTDQGFRDMVDQTRDALREAGYSVFSAHEREAWGANLWGPAEALQADLEELDRADLLIALVDDRISGGVQLEIGAALKMDLSILQICPKGKEARIAYLNRGLARFGRRARTVTYATIADCPAIAVAGANAMLPLQ